MDLYSSEGSDSDSQQFHSSWKEIDYSYRNVDNIILEEYITEWEDLSQADKKPMYISKIRLNHNNLSDLPQNICIFYNLRHLDLSNNRLNFLPEILIRLPLITLNLKNNHINNDRLPKTFQSWCMSMEKINLAGNNFLSFPPQIFELLSLSCLYLGNNEIEEIPNEISQLKQLVVFSVGSNHLTTLPDGIGGLENLEALIVNDNRLESLPSSIARLKKLKTIQLHKNRLRVLPTEMIKLRCLTELSLRDNPLVIKFVNDMTYNPASLLEMSARVIKVANIQYNEGDLPDVLLTYLATAHYCVNPACNGVYFDSRVEHIKFVDFCGKYRIPLLQYLCSSKCVDDTTFHPDQPDRMRKVLLG